MLLYAPSRCGSASTPSGTAARHRRGTVEHRAGEGVVGDEDRAGRTDRQRPPPAEASVPMPALDPALPSVVVPALRSRTKTPRVSSGLAASRLVAAETNAIRVAVVGDGRVAGGTVGLGAVGAGAADDLGRAAGHVADPSPSRVRPRQARCRRPRRRSPRRPAAAQRPRPPRRRSSRRCRRGRSTNRARRRACRARDVRDVLRRLPTGRAAPRTRRRCNRHRRRLTRCDVDDLDPRPVRRRRRVGHAAAVGRDVRLERRHPRRSPGRPCARCRW